MAVDRIETLGQAMAEMDRIMSKAPHTPNEMALIRIVDFMYRRGSDWVEYTINQEVKGVNFANTK